VGTVTTAPFSVAWQAVSGKHVLRVAAYDRAGNQAEATVKFTVKK